MPEIADLVDVEALLVAHLHADAELDAAVGADHVSTEIPADYDHRDDVGWVQVFRVSGTQVDPETGHVERALVQVHAHGATSVDAFAAMNLTHRALRRARDVAHALGVVTAVERVTGPSRNADPTSGAPRYSATYAVTVHPSRTA